MENAALTPATIGTRWVLPTVDLSVASQVQIEVSITVAGTDELSASDVTVQANASNNEPLTVKSSPSDVLPVTELRGLTAHAYFSFDNPSGLALTSIDVTVKGDSGTFAMPSSDSSSSSSDSSDSSSDSSDASSDPNA